VVNTVKVLQTLNSQHEALPLLEKIAANLPGMIFQFLQRQDGSHCLTYASSGCRQLYELEPAVVQADFQVLYQLIHPQDVQVFTESVAASYTHIIPWRWEGRIITPSGKLKWIQGASRPEQQVNGDILWDGMLMDITVRKEAEEKLRASEARYKAILDAIPDLMFRISRNGEYLDFNGEGTTVTISREEIIGKNLRDVLPHDVALMSIEAIAKTLDSRSLRTLEYQLSTPLGIRDYEARIVVSGQDEVLAIVRDITERKEAEVTLQGLADKFSKAFCASPDSITISTLKEGRFIEVNDSFVRLSGYQREEAIGRTAFELNIWVNSSDRLKLLQELQKKGFVRNLEFEFRCKSGEVIICLTSVEIIDLDGVKCILAVNHDITERKGAEIALRESEEKFAKAFRCSPNPITILTLKDQRYIDVNDSYLKVTGFLREEVIGRTRSELNIWVNSEDNAKIQKKLQSGGVISNQECHFYTKSGEPRVVLFSAEVINLGGEPCMLCVTNDITENKQADAQLRLTAERDRLLTESLGRIRRSLNLKEILRTTVREVRQFLQADRVFIGLLDTNTKNQAEIVAESVDPNYPAILGWVVNDDQHLQELRELFTQNQLRVIDDTTQISTCPKFTEHYAFYQVKAILGVPIMVAGEFLGALVAHQCRNRRNWQPMEIDLLQRMSEQVAIAIQQAQLYQQLAQLNTNLERQVEERTAQLKQKMQELQELNRVKDVVLHTVSHELRTSVIGTLMLLKNLHASSDDQISLSRNLVERMIQANEQQLTKINSLLELHSSDGQGIVLQREVVPFNSLIATIIPELQPMLAQNQATITNLIPEGLPSVMVDSKQLQRVLQNLLTYSLQHNPPGLKFTLKVIVETGIIRFYIQDNGVNMSKTECASLFDLYVREPQARSSTGISLKMYLCRQIIKAHGGEIGVNSNNRKRGISFWLTLPLVSSTQ
jgi:PAS domain S-box-containing protein